MDFSPPVKNLTWELFRSFASDLISPRIQIDDVQEAHKEACHFTVRTVSA
jgi:hypothetical protein